MSKLELILTAEGVDYTITNENGAIMSFQMTDDVLSLGRRANLEITPALTPATAQGKQPVLTIFNAGNPVTVKTQDTTLLTGYIETVQNIFENKKRKILITLIDKVGYIQTGNPLKAGKVYKKTLLTTIFARLLKDNGYNDIAIETDLPLASRSKLLLKEDATIKNGDTLGDFFDRYTNKLQLLYTSNAEGDLLITQEDTEATEYGLQMIDTGDTQGNNVISRTFRNSIENRFSSVIMYGAQKIDKTTTRAGLTIQEKATDNTAPVERTKIIQLQDSIEGTTARQYTRYLLNLSKSKAFIYECKKQGWFWDDGSLVQSNKRVNINDIDIKGEFHIKDVTYNYNATEGMTCDITILEKDVITRNQ